MESSPRPSSWVDRQLSKKQNLKQVKIGIWQGIAASSSKDSFEKIKELLEMCQKQQAEILVLPEMFLGGYHVIKNKIKPIGVAMLKDVAKLAKKFKVGIIFGSCTEEYEEGSYFSTVFAVDQMGEIVAKYHKRHLFGTEEENNLMPGKQIPEPFVIAGLRINVLISWDIEFPEDVRAAADDHRAQLLVVPAANTKPYDHINDYIIKARALETESFIIYCNWAETQTCEHLPPEMCGGRAFGFNGRSSCVNKKGKFIARFHPDDPHGLIFTQIPTVGHDDSLHHIFQYPDNKRIEHLFKDLGLSPEPSPYASSRHASSVLPSFVTT